jgi:hypothetical protein
MGSQIKAICRDLGVSRKVVRKVIRLGSTEFRYHREGQPLPKISRWRDTLDQLLLANEAKTSRERLTLIRIFEELRGRGYDGSYDAVRRYAGRWAKQQGLLEGLISSASDTGTQTVEHNKRIGSSIRRQEFIDRPRVSGTRLGKSLPPA